MRCMSAKFLVCMLALALGCKKEQQGGGNVSGTDTAVIKVGEVGSMTGTEATFGISSHNGIQLATDEVNAAGGIKGRKIQVLALDDQGKPEEAATAATRLISSEHVTALLGEVASTRSLFMAPKAQAAKVPMVSPSSTNEKVTAVGDYIFRACFIDPFQGYVMAKFATETLKLKKTAILRDVRNDYSVGLAKVFNDNFTKMGGHIADTESYSSGDDDLKAQLTNIKSAKPQALYVPGYYTDVGLIGRQAREVGLTVPLLGGDGWDSEKLYEIGGPALEGSYFSNHYSVDDPSPRIQEFVTKFKKAYGGQVPDSLAAQAYDAAGMLYDAMKRAKGLTGPSIRDALAQTKDYKGATGGTTLDARRNATTPARVLKVAKGGKYEFSGRIMPEGLKQSGTEAPAESPKKTEGNTAPNPAPGNTAPNPAPGNRPTPTPTPEVGATSAAQSAANTGQPQGVPAGEHPKK